MNTIWNRQQHLVYDRFFYKIYFCKKAVLLQIYISIKKNSFLTVPFFYTTYIYICFTFYWILTGLLTSISLLPTYSENWKRLKIVFGFVHATEVHKSHICVKWTWYAKDANALLKFLWNLVQIMWLQNIFLDKKVKIVLFYI